MIRFIVGLRFSALSRYGWTCAPSLASHGRHTHLLTRQVPYAEICRCWFDRYLSTVYFAVQGISLCLSRAHWQTLLLTVCQAAGAATWRHSPVAGDAGAIHALSGVVPGRARNGNG